MKLIIFTLAALMIGCSSQSIMPEKDEVKVSRETPDKDDCKFISKVIGSSDSIKATKEVVLEDMKQDAANKGANYVVVKNYSDTGTQVTGLAYQCN